MFNFCSSFCVLDSTPLSDVSLARVFACPQAAGCLFTLVTVALARQKLFHFVSPDLPCCKIISNTTEVLFRKSLPALYLEEFTCGWFLSSSFKVSGFVVGILIHLE